MAGRRNYQIDRRRTKTTKQQEMDANNFGDDDDDENEFEQEEFDEDQQEDVNPFGNDEDDDEENQEDAPQEELEQVQETLGAEEKQDNTVNEQEVEEQPAGDEDVEEEEEVSSINKEDSGEDYKEDSSVTEEEEEDEYEPEETTAAKRGRKRPPAAPVRASARAKRSSYGDDDDDDDDSDSDFGQPKRRARCNAGAKKKKYQEDSEEEQEFESEHSEEPSPPHNEKRRDRPPKAAAKAKALPRGRPAKRKVVKRKEDDDSEEEEEEFDEEEDDSDDSEFGKPRPKKNNKRNTRRSNRNGKTESSEEDEEEFSNPQTRLSAASRRSTPSRFSAALASQRLTDFPSEEEEQDEEVKPKPKPRNGKGSMSSDEEFLADSESEASDEKANNSESYDDDSSVHDNTPATAQVGDVDDNEVGTADESSDEEEFMDTPVAKKKVSQMDEITPRRSSQGNDDDDDDSSGSEAFVAEMRQRNSRPKLPVCPSIEDAITAETLPKRHVCYISPDGSSRQCFALETLRLIALKNTTRTFRVDLTGDQQTFLQPPHFRTSMSDDLLDQIASRFGREALELDGEFYRRKPIALNDDDDEQDGIFVPHHSLLRDHEAFMDHLERYIERQMGHQDIYTCPLCYSEMHRRIVAKQDDESDEERENEASDSPVESVYDPMLVLGYVDDDTFEAASAFCFTKVAKLKVHIREDHRVDTKGIQGNDMYARYKIRAPDGLLQRWLNNTNRFGTFQGDMRRYWNEGNNQNFVYLLQLMQRAEIYREILQDEDDEDRDVAEGYLLVARTFFESFANRVRHDWERLASPFFKSKGEDLKGFLVDDEDEEDEIPHFIAQRELAGQGEETSDANDLVSKIQRKYAEHEDDSEGDVSEEADDDENAEDEDGEDDSDANVEVPNGYYSEVEEEEDDWVKDIKSKRKSKSSPKNVNGSATKRVGKKLTKRKSTPSPSSAKLEPEPSSSASKKLVILEDSEDE